MARSGQLQVGSAVAIEVDALDLLTVRQAIEIHVAVGGQDHLEAHVDVAVTVPVAVRAALR